MTRCFTIVLILFTAFAVGCNTAAPPDDMLPASPRPTATSLPPTDTPVESGDTAAELPPATLEVSPEQATPTAASDSTPDLTTTTPAPAPARYGYTHQRPDGNRVVAGRADLPAGSPIDIMLKGEPQWVVAVPAPNEGSLWAVALTDGDIQAFRIAADGAVSEVSADPSQLSPGMPPLLELDGDRLHLLTASTDAASLETHPVLLPQTGQMVSIQAGGDLLVWGEGQTDFSALPVAALPDARLLTDGTDRLLVLTDATTRYGHGVLGDRLEAASISLIETRPEPRVVTSIPIPDPTVVEGIAPIWADLTGDGQREIIVTLSNSAVGAQIAVYNEVGEQIATGPTIGKGNRWRHQLAVAPFGPDGRLELVDVLTPHIGGVVEFYELQDDRLNIVASVPGYTSHVIGTRNLDMAVAGDFDGDNRVELLLPNQIRTELGAIQRTADGAEVDWTLPVDGLVSSNLAAVSRADGRLMVGVGRADGVLRIWGQ